LPGATHFRQQDRCPNETASHGDNHGFSMQSLWELMKRAVLRGVPAFRRNYFEANDHRSETSSISRIRRSPSPDPAVPAPNLLSRFRFAKLAHQGPLDKMSCRRMAKHKPDPVAHKQNHHRGPGPEYYDYIAEKYLRPGNRLLPFHWVRRGYNEYAGTNIALPGIQGIDFHQAGQVRQPTAQENTARSLLTLEPAETIPSRRPFRRVLSQHPCTIFPLLKSVRAGEAMPEARGLLCGRVRRRQPAAWPDRQLRRLMRFCGKCRSATANSETGSCQETRAASRPVRMYLPIHRRRWNRKKSARCLAEHFTALE